MADGPRNAGPGVMAARECDAICRLLIPPKIPGQRSAGVLPLRNLLQALPSVAESLGDAASAWQAYSLRIDGSNYSSALRVGNVVLATATHATRAATRWLCASIGVSDETDAMLAGSGDDEATAAAAEAIVRSAVAIVGSVSRLKLQAWQTGVESLRTEVDTYRAHCDGRAVEAELQRLSRVSRHTDPLVRAVLAAQRDMAIDTFKVPPSVHEVLGVLEQVGRAIRGDDKPAMTEVDPNDPVAVMRAEFQASIAAVAEPPPPPHGKGFVNLLSNPDDVQGAAHFPRLWTTVRNNLAAMFDNPAVAPNAGPVPWSSVVTPREDPGALSRALEHPQALVLSIVANHLHATIGRFPENMTAFYAVAVVLCDVATFLEPFNVPLSQTCATGVGGAVPSTGGVVVGAQPSYAPERRCDGLHRCLNFVQPARSGPQYPDCSLHCLDAIHMLAAIGADKLLAEIDRIVSEAAAAYEPPPSDAADDQPSGALLTVLSSAAQPLLAVFARFPTSRVPSIMELFALSVGRLVDAVAGNWAVLREDSPRLAGALVRDAELLRRFFDNHPTLCGAADTPEDKRRRRLYDSVGWGDRSFRAGPSSPAGERPERVDADGQASS